ncbi:hypothetical protein FH972_001100 [Carpinus fangiana]|uniref:HMA domain-containing protein n=1 Tax=Carpinus fangiana TaxID=176857 RepID=A0A5N6QCJ7_9ROSI|nr:hypothetical protein FH972_001100 [Carpinus fangiana]
MQLESERSKSKAEKFAYAVEGIAYLSDCVSSVNIDRTAHTLTVSGTFDPIDVAKELRKLSRVTIISIEPEEKSGKMKEELDKEQSKTAKLEEAGPSEEGPKKDDVGKLSDLYEAYNHESSYYHLRDVKGYPNACVIC